MKTYGCIATAAGALSLMAALPAGAQASSGQDVPAPSAEAVVTQAASASAGQDAQATTLGIVTPTARAERDTTLRTRGAVAAKGQAAGGLGNVTDHVEVAGGAQASAEKVSVSDSGSVATGNN